MLNSLNTPRFSDYAYFVIVALIFLWGGYLRMFQLGEPSFWIDEAFALESARAIVSWNDDIEAWRSVIYNALLGTWINLFGESEWHSRILSVVFSLGLIVILERYTRQRGGMLAGLFVAIFLSFSYWQIAWARQAREYALLSLVVWGAVVLVNWLGESKMRSWQKLLLILGFTCFAAGVHPFGLLVALVAVMYLLCGLWPKASYLGRGLIFFLYVFLLIGLPFAMRQFFQIEGSAFPVYAGFFTQTYGSLLFGLLGALVLAWRSQLRFQIVWISSVLLLGAAMVAFALPITNLRYLQFLVPGVVVVVALGIAYRPSTGSSALAIRLIIFTGVLGVLVAQGGLVIKPQKNYALESYQIDPKFTFYTPQPEFKLAYAYLNNRLPKADLVTPYPAISRRYRQRDDIVALNSGLEYPRRNRDQVVQREFYTDIYYADGGVLLQLAEQLGSIYVLTDQMALERLELLTQLTITSQGQLIRSWRKPPFSNLYLYRISKL